MIKWNPRTAPVEKIAAQRCTDVATAWTVLREYLWCDSTLRRSTLRRRIQTVMQERMFKAARIISHARGWVLGASGAYSGFAVFEPAHAEMKAAQRRSLALTLAHDWGCEFTGSRKHRVLREEGRGEVCVGGGQCGQKP